MRHAETPLTPDYESEGRAFESLRVRQPTKKPPHRGGFFVGFCPLRVRTHAFGATRKGARRRRRPEGVRVVKTARINRSECGPHAPSWQRICVIGMPQLKCGIFVAANCTVFSSEAIGCTLAYKCLHFGQRFHSSHTLQALRRE